MPVRGADAAVDFTEMSLQELMAVEVTSVSKRRELMSGAPAAVHVITQEDLKRNGTRTIPDALRLVPGMAVAQLNSSTWAVTARGSNSRFANKLLVMIDGRSVYTPLFSGVFWDRQDVLLEDVDRIEVIRGPGASLWGANAVNGVINIITKNAAETQGGYAEVGGGVQEQAFTAVRYGAAVGDNAHLRVFAKADKRDSGELDDGSDGGDEWQGSRSGFRADVVSGANRWRVQGNAFSSVAGEKFPLPTLVSPYSEERAEDSEATGANLTLALDRDLGGGSSLALQGYLTYSKFDDVRIAERRTTFDIEAAYKLPLGTRHRFQWGVGYRRSAGSTSSGENISLDPSSDTIHLASAFVQDTIMLDGPSLQLTVGTKLEHHSYTGLELQPSARVAWEPQAGTTYWAAASRAVRTPSEAEKHVLLDQQTLAPSSPGNPSAFPALVRVTGSNAADSELLTAFEAGGRWQLDQAISLDVATFYNIYDRLISAEFGSSTFVASPTPHLVIPYTVNNKADATAYGLEFYGNWQVTPSWLLSAGYTFFEGNSNRVDGNSPEHQVQVRSRANLSDRTRLDAVLRYVDHLPALNIDPYLTMDFRLAHSISNRTTVSLVGRNLLQSDHFEFGTEATLATHPSKVMRTLYVAVEHKF